MNVKKQRKTRLALLAAMVFCAGCETSPLTAPPAAESVSSPVKKTNSATTKEEPKPACKSMTFGIVACPNQSALVKWAEKTHVKTDVSKTKPFDPPDPVEIRDGMVVYDELLHSIARKTRVHLDLWATTPTFSRTERTTFENNPDLWAKVVEFRSAKTQQKTTTIRRAIRADERDLLRALLLRNGVLYVEDPGTASYVSRFVGLDELFDIDQIELHRAGVVYTLARDARGQYRYTRPSLDRAVADIHLFDRVGPPGTLQPMGSYELQKLRREHGLSNIVVGEETSAGRTAAVRFFDGEKLDGVFVLDENRKRHLAVVADPKELIALRDSNVHDRRTVCGLMEVADKMARERLDFDEPKIEFGQQDGHLRHRFATAYAKGRSTYRYNGYTYKVFDRNGHALVPQLCIDFITDAVDRSHGNWWAPKGEKATESDFRMRDYMRFRTVRNLIELATQRPGVATLRTVPRNEQIPYTKRDAFFEHLWESRDEVREGDIVVIYGLRSDNQNHFHSFYIRETDPVYGMPLVIAANPGYARIQPWHDVMRESPKRSIRYFIRWNPTWLRVPAAVDSADHVSSRAKAIAGTPDVMTP